MVLRDRNGGKTNRSPKITDLNIAITQEEQDNLNASLCEAVRWSEASKVRTLLGQKADPTACRYSQDIPDVSNENFFSRKSKVLDGADVHKTKSESGAIYYSNGNCFHDAACKGDKEIMKLLLDAVEDKTLLQEALRSEAYIEALFNEEKPSFPTPIDLARKHNEVMELFDPYIDTNEFIPGQLPGGQYSDSSCSVM